MRPAVSPNSRLAAHRSRARARRRYFFLPAGASAACGGAPASAAFGRGAGLSDLEFRNAMTSARSLPRGRPVKVILVPGTKALGLVRYVLRSSTDQFPPLPCIAAE